MQSRDDATAIVQDERMLYKPKRVRLQGAIAIYTMRLTKQFTIGERAAVCLKDIGLSHKCERFPPVPFRTIRAMST